jgi:hypothetical protein
MSDTAFAPALPRPFRPPAPQPHVDQLNRLQLLLALRRNPLTIWRRAHFEELSLSGPGIQRRSGTFLSRMSPITARMTCN